MRYSGLLRLKGTIFFFIFVRFCYFMFKVNLLGGGYHFLDLFFVFVCVYLFVCVGGGYLQSPEEGVGHPGAGMFVNCCVGPGNSPGPAMRAESVLTTDPSLPTLSSTFKCFNSFSIEYLIIMNKNANS